MNLPVGLTQSFILSICLCLVPVAAQAKSSLDGTLTVVNDRYVPVSVSVDQDPAGVVAPHTVRRFQAIPNGVRVVRITSTGRSARVEHLKVPVRGVAALTVAPERGAAVIHNDAKVKMRISLDGHLLGIAAPGKALSTGPLTVGHHGIIATPVPRWARKAEPVKLRLVIRAGVESAARIAPLFAGLRVTNPTRRSVAILIDGERAGTIGPREESTLARQLPGAHRVELRCHGRTLASAAVHLVSGQVRSWRPRIARRGDLELTNATGRRLRISIDGHPQGILAPGEVRIVKGLDAGRVVVTSHGAGGWSREQVVKIRPHRLQVVRLNRPRPRPHGQLTTALHTH